MRAVKVPITQEMIDVVFSDPKLCKKFPRPQIAKRVCEMRVAGVVYAEIAKRCKASNYYCMQTVDKVVRLFTVFVERLGYVQICFQVRCLPLL